MDKKTYSRVKYVAQPPIQIWFVFVIGLCFRLKAIMVQQMPFMIQTDVFRKHMRSASIRVTFLQHNSDYTEVYRRKNRQSGCVCTHWAENEAVCHFYTLSPIMLCEDFERIPAIRSACMHLSAWLLMHLPPTLADHIPNPHYNMTLKYSSVM